jgi:hypothetical protein
MTPDEEEGSVLKQTAEWFVGRLVKSKGDFIPLAVTISPRGEVKGVTVNVVAGGGGIYDQLVAALRQAVGEGRYRGVAVCAPGTVTEPGTTAQVRAAIIDIEHEGLEPRTWIWPFEKVGSDYRFGGRTGEGYVVPGNRQLFGADAGEAPGKPFGPLVESIAVSPADVARMRATAQGGSR